MRPNKQPLNAPWRVQLIDEAASCVRFWGDRTDGEDRLFKFCDCSMWLDLKLRVKDETVTVWWRHVGGVGEPDSIAALVSVSELIHPCGTSWTGKGHTSELNSCSSYETASNAKFNEVWPLFFRCKAYYCFFYVISIFSPLKNLLKSDIIKSFRAWWHNGKINPLFWHQI